MILVNQFVQGIKSGLVRYYRLVIDYVVQLPNKKAALKPGRLFLFPRFGVLQFILLANIFFGEFAVTGTLSAKVIV